jgi:hypothetical protein
LWSSSHSAQTRVSWDHSNPNRITPSSDQSELRTTCLAMVHGSLWSMVGAQIWDLIRCSS